MSLRPPSLIGGGAKLSEQEQDDVTAIVELLEEMGPRLPFPYSSGVEASRHSPMRELRIQSHGETSASSTPLIPTATPSC